MILVTGATGTSGKEIVRELSAVGARVRALVRDPQKASDLKRPGVEAFQGDLGRPESLGPALRGVEKVLLLTPVDRQSVEQSGNFVAAARKAGVRHLVRFSAMGASADAASVLLRWHGQAEQEIQRSGIPFTVLRPNAFMQNFGWSAQSIAGQGALYAPMREGSISFVDVRDIAAVAARVLTEPGHEGKTYELTGPESLTHAEIAARFSAVLGKQVTYVDVPPDEFRKGAIQAGQPEWFAAALTELYGMFASGTHARVTNVVAEVSRTKPRTVDQFIRDHLGAFRPN